MITQTPAGAALRSRIYVATANMGKVHELHALFNATRFDLDLFGAYSSPREGVESYTANAALKARTLHTILAAHGRREYVLADDSGLEVAALDGRPGVTTADYGGADASWPDRRAKLLAEVAASANGNRRARFVCAMYVIDADGREFGSLGTVDGVIASVERGELGFSFDPIFLYPPAGSTFAELSDTQKNRVSHRAIAAAAIIAALDAASVSVGPEESREASRPASGNSAHNGT